MIGIDQSTQGTKVLLFDRTGKIVRRVDRSHRQIVNAQGWVSHDMNEIYRNLLDAARELLDCTGVSGDEIAAIGISNQRETTVCWDEQGRPLAPAVVWQCGRAGGIVEAIRAGGQELARRIRDCSGIPLSPFFPAAKMRWILENEEAVRSAGTDRIRLGTVDSYLVYRLTDGAVYATDVSNASRTQLMDIRSLSWSGELCRIFGVPAACLPEIRLSDAGFGETDLGGLLPQKVPIQAVMGDSHAALFGQGCHSRGMMKTTYGTGSSMMLNTGSDCVSSSRGLATSVAWGRKGQVSYVLEGNINYTGAVMSWLKDDLGLFGSTGEINSLIAQAAQEDTTVLVPAFSGLGAPYWDAQAKAAIVGMSRTTRKPELVKAAAESIAHQITDIFEAMERDYGSPIAQLRGDGGPTRNPYLMQFQSDMLRRPVLVPSLEELSAAGAAYMAGIAAGCCQENVFDGITYTAYEPLMEEGERSARRTRWRGAVESVLTGPSAGR